MSHPNTDRNACGGNRHFSIDANEAGGYIRRDNGGRYTSGVNMSFAIIFNQFIVHSSFNK